MNFIIDKYKDNIVVNRKRLDGVQVVYKFNNEYEISIVNFTGSYGNEVGIIKDGYVIDIMVYLQSEDELEKILDDYSGR